MHALNTGRLRSWAAAAAAVVVLRAVAGVTPAQGLPACTAADITAQDPACPLGSGACTIAANFEIADGCTLAFGDRAVELQGKLTIGPGTVTLGAGSLTITPTGFIDGRGNQTGPPGDSGGFITITTTGNVFINKQGLANGKIDVSGRTSPGTIEIDAGGSITVAGRIIADNLTPAAGRGTISLTAAGDVVFQPTGVMSATGGADSAGGGDIDIEAGGTINLQMQVKVTGVDGGNVNMSANESITVGGIKANSSTDAGSGGILDLAAGTTLSVTGPIQANGSGPFEGFGGDGGFVCLEAEFGDLSVAAGILAEAAGPDGGGGELTLVSRGSMTIAGKLSARGNGGDGCGGVVTLRAGANIAATELIDASGGAAGSDIDITAGLDASLNILNARGRNSGADGGLITVDAGNANGGTLTINDVIDAGAGGCSNYYGCGAAGEIDLAGCDVTVTARGKLLASAPSGGDIAVSARELLTIAGRVNASGSDDDGTVQFEHPSRKSPVISGLITPDATMTAMDTCTSDSQQSCLLPCPSCGNGVVEFPETCDNDPGSPPAGCDGCSAFCQAENCDDGSPATIDLCDPLLGCRHVVAPTPTMTPTVTATPSATQTATPTPTSTATSTVPAPACAGDCNGGGTVSALEIQTMIVRNLVCGGDPVGECNNPISSLPQVACANGDANDSGTITALEIQSAIINSLLGCPLAVRGQTLYRQGAV